MRHKWRATWLICCVVALSLAVGGCFGGVTSITPPGNGSPPGDVGNLRIVAHAVGLEWRDEVKSAQYELKPAVGAARLGELEVGPHAIMREFTQLAVGEWTASVVLYDNGDEEIGRGSGTATVVKNGNLDVVVAVHSYGELELDVMWREVEEIDEVKVRLTHEMTGETMEYEPEIDGIGARVELPQLYAGRWFYAITLLDEEGEEVAARTGIFTVVRGQMATVSTVVSAVGEVRLSIGIGTRSAETSPVRLTLQHLDSGTRDSQLYVIPDHRPDALVLNLTLREGLWCAVAELTDRSVFLWGQTRFEVFWNQHPAPHINMYWYTEYPTESCLE